MWAFDVLFGRQRSSEKGGGRVVPDDMRAHLTAGFATVLLMAGAIGGWAATTELAGAVIGAGTVVVDSNVKKVQHPTGGIVGELRVREGARVAEGDLLIRLDETITRANLGVVMSQLYELNVRQGRLFAERDDEPEITLNEWVVARQSISEVQRLITTEQRLFESRRNGRNGQRAQLNERLNQLGEELKGLEGQHGAKTKESEFIKTELGEIEKLWKKNLAPLSKYTQLNREATRIDGERGSLIANMAQNRAKAAETRLQILQLDTDLKTEVSKELREVQSRQAELNERRIAAEDQLRRVEIRAPDSGIVHMLSVHTVGGVINAGEQVMLIVPNEEALVLEVKIGPNDISQVKVGQEAVVRLTSFNQRTTPEIKGQVSRVSADLTREPQSGQIFFIIRVSFTEEQLKRLDGQRLVPGLPAEVYVQTEQRTALSYLMKPIADQMARAFRER